MIRNLLAASTALILMGTAASAQYRYKMMPDSPGAQNNSAWNNNSGWNSGGWNNNSGWNSGGWSHDGDWYDDDYYYPPWNQSPYPYGHRPQYRPPAPRVVYSNQPITIAMPPDQPGPCAYVLASGDAAWNYTMSPGQSQTFNEDRAWQITFDRGQGYGEQTYALRPGLYRFRLTSRGWELYRSTTPAPAPFASAPPPPM